MMPRLEVTTKCQPLECLRAVRSGALWETVVPVEVFDNGQPLEAR